MNNRGHSEPVPNPDRSKFLTTQWSVVHAAGDTSTPESRQALEELFGTYYYPLYSFVRGMGFSHEDAQDLLQDYLLRLLEQKKLRRANRGRGRFRSFLLSDLKHFCVDQWRRQKAQKRGGDRLVSLDGLEESAKAMYLAEPQDESDPAKIFDRNWFRDLVRRSLKVLEEEYVAQNMGSRFEILQGFLPGNSSKLTQTEAAVLLSLTENAVRQAISELRRRLRDKIKKHVAQTCASYEDYCEELRHLLSLWQD